MKVARKKTVLVKFIGDDRVVENIVDVKGKKIDKTKSDIRYEKFKVENLRDEQEKEIYIPSTELLAEENDIQGKEMFNFTSSRKTSATQGLVKIIGASYQNKLKSKKSSERKKNKTVNFKKSFVRKQNEANNSSEPSRYHLRQRIKQELATLRSDKIDSDLEEGNSDSWCDDSESDEDEETRGSPSLYFDSQSRQSVMKTYAEDYFLAHKEGKSLTSNHTLSRFNFPQSDIKQLGVMYKNSKFHKRELSSLLHFYYSMFKKWMFLLREGFNVLLYGIGSKYNILQNFLETCLKDKLYIVVHGFFPALSVKQILCSITEDAINHEESFSNIYEHAEFIKNYFSSDAEELYLIIHNIDGTVLRGLKNQSLLSLLCSAPNIHVLASVDHINSPLIWNQINLSQFNWIWYDVTTFEPYIMETSYENSHLGERSGHLMLSSLLHVYRSLTPNGCGVFLILAKEQMEEKENSSYLGITFHEWYQKCREAFLVNSELTMQAQLTEYKDHKLLLSRKSTSGVEHLYIPIDNATLEQFLEKEGS